MKRITLDDLQDALKVVAALQEAVDEVLDASKLQQLAADMYNNQDYQHVHPADGPAVARAVLMVGGCAELQHATRLSVEIQVPGGAYNTGPAEKYVPWDVISHLSVRLDNPSHFQRKFEHDDLNHKAVVHLDLPTQAFVDCPRAVIEIV